MFLGIYISVAALILYIGYLYIKTPNVGTIDPYMIAVIIFGAIAWPIIVLGVLLLSLWVQYDLITNPYNIKR